MSNALAVVLAAGKGTRMKSELPKVLIEVAGRPMIHFVLDALSAGGVEQFLVVVGYRADLVQRALRARSGLRFVEQKVQLGTGHAVMACRDALASHDDPVLIVTGDSPLTQPESIRRLLAEFARLQPACLLGTLHKANPAGLGRIVRDALGEFSAIVEEKDATPDQRRITEVNLSCYVFQSTELLSTLSQIRPENAQGEFYLTDCPGLLKAAGKKVVALPILDPLEALSVNTPDELAAVEAALRPQQ